MAENKKVWEYGTDPKTGLSRRLVLNSVIIEEESELNEKPSIVIHLREQTYINDVTVTDKSAGYKVTKGNISKDINGEILPKRIIQIDGSLLPVYKEDGITPQDRDNGYDNIMIFIKNGAPLFTILDEGVKEYYKIV